MKQVNDLLNEKMDENLNINVLENKYYFTGGDGLAKFDTQPNLESYTLESLPLSSATTSSSTNSISGWSFWRDYYYPEVIQYSYPIYLQERAFDKGQKAFEVVKKLKDKRLIHLEKVADFIDIMDELIKIL